MSREILFKAKRLSDGKWVSGGTIVQFLDDGIRNFYMPQFNEKCDSTHDDLTDDILGFENCRFYKVDEETICQYTGLTDKNGNKIWENDILCYHDTRKDTCVVKLGEYSSNGHYKHIGFFTDWVTHPFEYRQDLGFWANEREIEVIGNVFDNSELLKKENPYITNGDKIRSMTDEELADAIMKDHNIAYAIDFCHSDEKCEDYMEENTVPDEWCRKCLIRWLQEEVE